MIWIISALMTAGVLAMIIRPLISGNAKVASRADFDITVYRDQLKEVERDQERGLLNEDQAAAATTEIKRRMLAAVEEKEAEIARPSGQRKAMAAALVVVIAGGGFGSYLYYGSPDQPDMPLASRPDVQTAAPSGGVAHPEGAGQVEQMVENLARRLVDEPGNYDGWIMLARSYVQLQKPEKAVQAYRQALRIQESVGLKADLAEAIYMARGGGLDQEAADLMLEVKEQNPYNPKPYFYLGMGLAQNGNIRGAMQLWVDLIEISPPDAPWQQEFFQLVSQAAENLGIDPNEVEPSAEAKELAANRPAPSAVAGVPSAPGAEARTPSADGAAAVMQMSPEERDAFMRDRVAAFAERVKENPGDIEGWRQLVRFYQVLGETEKMKEAQERVAALENHAASAGVGPIGSGSASMIQAPSQAGTQAIMQMSPEERDAFMRDRVAAFAEKVKENPDDIDGWRQLARFYQVLGETEKESEANAKIKELQSR